MSEQQQLIELSLDNSIYEVLQLDSSRVRNFYGLFPSRPDSKRNYYKATAEGWRKVIDDLLYREIIRTIRKVDGVRGDGVTNTATAITIAPRSNPRAAQPRAVHRLVVKSIANDYTTCRTLDADDGEADLDVYVAKPPEVRHSLAIAQAYYNAALTGFTTTGTQEAEVTDGDVVEEVQAFPRYSVGCELYAEFQPRGGTGVLDAAGDPVQWLELPGRVWAKQC